MTEVTSPEGASTIERRRPWLAAIANLAVAPVGHVYAGAPLRGVLLYLASGTLVAGAYLASIRVSSAAALVALLLVIAAGYFALVVDGLIVARRANPYRLRSYNRWYVYVSLAIVLASAQELARPMLRSAVQAFKIPSRSMIPTLLIGDHVLADMRAYHDRPPDRGEMIVFDYPVDPAKVFMKRVIGLPGETIEIRDKAVFIDGSPLDEPYVAHVEGANPSTLSPRDNFGPLEIPTGSYFVMGDNRDRSYDSRFWGPVAGAAIHGRIHVIYWSWSSDDTSVRWDRIGHRVR